MNYGGTTIDLEYNVDAMVLDQNGNVAASKNFKGEDRTRFALNANYFDEIKKAHRQRLEAILNDDVLARAF